MKFAMCYYSLIACLMVESIVKAAAQSKCHTIATSATLNEMSTISAKFNSQRVPSCIEIKSVINHFKWVLVAISLRSVLWV